MNVSVGILVHDDRILFMRRNKSPYKGKLSFPGGKVEDGETVEESLHREIHEETGLDLKEVKKVGLFDEYLEGEGEVQNFKLHIFRAVPIHFNHISSKEGELVEIRISDLKNQRDEIVPSDFRMIERVIFNNESGFKTRIDMVKKDDDYIITEEKNF